MEEIIVRRLEKNEIDGAVSLCWEVFQAYEAPDYTADGVKEFDRSIHNLGFISQLDFRGAFDGGELAGVIAVRGGGHIALFFVKGDRQGRGIGRRLFESTLNDCLSDKLTVNAAPFARNIYRHFGFTDADKEQEVNGLRFTPMAYYINPSGE